MNSMIKFTHKRKSVTRLMAPVAFAVLMAGCSSNPYFHQAPNTDITAAATLSSADYLSKAQASEGADRINWDLLALKALIKEGRYPQAEQLTDQLSRQTMSPMQIAEWQLARADLRNVQGNAQLALSGLQFQPSWSLATSQYRRYYQLRAKLLEQLDQGFAAARERTKLDLYLSPEQKQANWQALWQDLSPYSNEQLSQARIGKDETVLQGWAQLAMLKNSYGYNPEQLKEKVNQWLSMNPYHPANAYLPEQLDNIMNMKAPQLNKVALLLPLSGRFSAQGQAVRDGFMNAILDDPNRNPNAVLNVYDTDAESIASIAGKLQQNGTEFVVGPLRKDKIVEFQKANSANVPMLALNEPSVITSSQPTACYYSLSPEQEAEQAAEHIYQEGKHYPIVLFPDSSYGQRVSAAFVNQWKELTGYAPFTGSFGSKAQIQQQISQIFGPTARRSRANQIAQISASTGIEGSRAVDAIYIIGSKSELTLIKPFIELNIDPSIAPPAMYASSRSNSDSKSFELNGVEYSDIPLLVSPDPSFMAHFNQLWPNQGKTSVRLHAFGMDAYKVATELPQLRAIPGFTASGATGKLSVDSQCVVQRQLDWGTFGSTPMTEEAVTDQTDTTATDDASDTPDSTTSVSDQDSSNTL